jgi:hypothetical protein
MLLFEEQARSRAGLFDTGVGAYDVVLILPVGSRFLVHDDEDVRCAFVRFGV